MKYILKNMILDKLQDLLASGDTVGLRDFIGNELWQIQESVYGEAFLSELSALIEFEAFCRGPKELARLSVVDKLNGFKTDEELLIEVKKFLDRHQ